MHHPGGCIHDEERCYRDAQGVEWHPGSIAGMYRVIDGEIVILTRSAKGTVILA